MGRVRTKTVKKSSRQVIEGRKSVSLKLQQKERERCLDFVPDESAIKTDVIGVHKETIDMLSALGMGDLLGSSSKQLSHRLCLLLRLLGVDIVVLVVLQGDIEVCGEPLWSCFKNKVHGYCRTGVQS
ncbi:unnamed protein product [Ilex paraguariensis]|uniref:Uncharacterized protein n=1 Tax=Ilex paraguariensis TaxID=185542 RepID=A0ABC8SFK3_9AQUA